MQRRLALTLLSLLSASRFALAIAFVFTSDDALRLGLILTAALTDFADGFWARRGHLTTRFGALLDPLADRTFVLTALTVYMSEGALALWAYSLLLLRDVATTLAFLATRLSRTFRQVSFQARLPGKIVTSVQLLVLLVVPLAPGWIAALVALSTAASLWAIADYAVIVWRRRAVRGKGDRPRFPDQPVGPVPQAG